MESGRVDALLRDFEARVDKRDPEQCKLLEAVREQTARLHHARGDWNRPSTERSWNADALPAKDTPPLQLPSYRDYVAHKAAQERSGACLALCAPDTPCKSLPAAAWRD